ncbi:MAG: hypothetical protein JWO03_31 [Bacteroidetes bacterium]|nr:hypothetical protein [Bacteroidota bacterium]
MKKLLLAAALLIAASATTFAATNCQTTPLIAEKNISESIRSQIQFPEFLKEKEGEHNATIIFKVNACGTINIREIQTDDDDLRTDLMAQAPNFKVNTAACLDSRDTYKVVVRFKTL